MNIPILKKLTTQAKKEEYAKYFELIPDFKKEKTQKFITIVLTIIASIVLALFAINPTLSTIGNLRKQLDDSRYVDQKLQEKINNLTVLQQKYATIQDDLTVVYNAVPRNSEVANLAAEVQAIAKESNLNLSEFQTFEISTSQGATSGKKYSSFDFSITATGNYEDMLVFLDKLVNFQRILSVDEVAIVKAGKVDKAGLQLNVRATAYFKE